MQARYVHPEQEKLPAAHAKQHYIPASKLSVVSTQRKLWRSQIEYLYSHFKDVLKLSTEFVENTHVEQSWTHFKKNNLNWSQNSKFEEMCSSISILRINILNMSNRYTQKWVANSHKVF